MSAVETLIAAEAAGLRLGVDGTDLLVEAGCTPSKELLNALRHDKSEILVLLRTREAGEEVLSAPAIRSPNLQDMTLAELEKVAGDHWPEIRDDTVRVEALAHAIVTRHQRERGDRPASWTEISECAGCGPVYLWPGSPTRVLGCPWCFNRAEGRSIPQPVASTFRTCGN